MEFVKITEDIVRKANAYAPIEEKEAFVEHCAQKCRNSVTINLGEEADNMAMPYMYTEDVFRKSRYLMGAFLTFYLSFDGDRDLETENGDKWLLTQKCYDLFAESQVMNQLERFKGNAELRDKVFDLLRDYRDLEKKLNTTIYNNLTVMNDPINRMFLKISMDTSEQAMEEQKKNLAELVKEFEELKKNNPPTPIKSAAKE